MDAGLIQVAGRFWRMLRLLFQRAPLSGEGARLYGGRWNPIGRSALYMAADHATAVAEFHQDYVIPGTLVAFDVCSDAIADLTDGHGGPADASVREALDAHWLRMAQIEGTRPPSWVIAESLVAAGVHGALVPSVQHRGGTNLVLWRWQAGAGDGADVQIIDPLGELGT